MNELTNFVFIWIFTLSKFIRIHFCPRSCIQLIISFLKKFDSTQ